MKYLRIAIICIFALSLGIGVWAEFQYNMDLDSDPPQLRCENDYLEISVSSDKEKLLEGLTAYDENDGDLTDRIMVASTSHFLEPGTCKVKYAVFDSHNNSTTLTRTVHYSDYIAPRFSLSEPLVYDKGDNIRYLNYVTAFDVIDGDISERIKVKSSSVSNYTANSYPVVLEVTNSFGDTALIELNVVVQEPNEFNVDITLKDYLLYIEQGESFSPGENILSVTGPSGDALRKTDVDVLGSVDTGQPGCYQLVYSYSDGKDQGQAYLTVVVLGEEG